MDRQGNQIDLFVSILVRFPQIGTIHYEPDAKTIRFVFLLKDPNQDFQKFARTFESHLSLFHLLRDGDVGVATLKKIENNLLATIEVTRDFASISLTEINLIVELFSDYYGDALLQEGPQMIEEDMVEQNMIIDALLNSSSCLSLERLTGFRENGRVLVFSTPLGVSKS